ncbi:MAG: hypothetical protein V2I27_04685 [Erythrobacter sp.]|jgi:hypothetical protein|nr:hypothetical protein [Erythrobacter sp.]
MSGPTLPDSGTIARVQALAMTLGIDGAALIGAGLVVYGINMIHRPSAFIIGGLLLIALSLLAARRTG